MPIQLMSGYNKVPRFGRFALPPAQGFTVSRSALEAAGFTPAAAAAATPSAAPPLQITVPAAAPSQPAAPATPATAATWTPPSGDLPSVNVGPGELVSGIGIIANGYVPVEASGLSMFAQRAVVYGGVPACAAVAVFGSGWGRLVAAVLGTGLVVTYFSGGFSSIGPPGVD
jgi:hypothetical protein